MRNEEGVVGLIQFNDRRHGGFTLERIEILEGIGSQIGTALTRKRTEQALRERVKELTCLYGIADLIEREENLDKILQGTVDLMPRGWMRSDIACARIVMHGQAFTSANFHKPAQQQAADVLLLGKPVGMVELGYLEERPVMYEGPFLREERDLINAIAGRLGRVAERKQAEQLIERARQDVLAEQNRLAALSQTLAEHKAALELANAELAAANRALALNNETLEARVTARTADLARRTDQTRALARELTRAEERVLHHAAHVIHDELQQLLSVARINLGIVIGQIEAEQSQKSLTDVDNLIAESLEVTRSLTAELSPAILHRSSLAATLRWLGRWFGDRFGLTVAIDAEEDADVEEEIRVTIFRSVRELLFNVVKHACVSTAQVSLTHAADGSVHVVISDDGVGFDPRAARLHEGTRGSFGLASLHQRLELLGGRLDVESAPGCGASFTLIAPISERGVPANTVNQAVATVRKPRRARRAPVRKKKG